MKGQAVNQSQIQELPIDAPEPMQSQPFSMSRFVSIWHCDCEHEVNKNLVYLWEPLHCPPEVTKDDRASWNFDHVTFYSDKRKENHWIRVNRHLMFDRGASPDVVILHSGLCVELTTGQIIWRESHQRWFIRWSGYTHSRFAKLAKAGLEAYRQG